MSSLWPIKVQDATGTVRFAGHAKGVPPNAVPTVVQVRVPFDTPGLHTGLPIGKGQPVGFDVILGAWFAVGGPFGIPWNGVTPRGDIYTQQLLNDTGKGLFATVGAGAQDMTEGETAGTLGYVTGNFFWPAPGVASPVSVDSNAPWKFVVSRDGTPTGGAPGATQGFALLNLLIARAS